MLTPRNLNPPSPELEERLAFRCRDGSEANRDRAASENEDFAGEAFGVQGLGFGV